MSFLQLNMIPGLGGMNPKKMQAMMKQLGIKQEEIEAERVIIEGKDKRIVIEDPNVQKVGMSGQESWQITGNAVEEDLDSGVKEDDVKLVMEKTGKSEGEVKKVLEENSDLAQAIVKLS